jgi:hypothetical protein
VQAQAGIGTEVGALPLPEPVVGPLAGTPLQPTSAMKMNALHNMLRAVTPGDPDAIQ